MAGYIDPLIEPTAYMVRGIGKKYTRCQYGGATFT